MRDRIRKLYERGREYRNWYANTREELEEIFGRDVDVFLHMIAATSANAEVSGNVTLALKAYEQYRKGESPSGYLPAVKKNLRRIWDGDLNLKGGKIGPFARALCGDRHAVVVDRWMYRAYESKDKEYIEQQIREDADEAGVAPCEFQAAVWCGLRKGSGDNRSFEEIVRVKLGLHQRNLQFAA